MTVSNGTTPDLLAGLPIQPTGSGVADLEIAYEQMQLMAQDDAATAADPLNDGGAAPAPVPTEDGQDAIESAAHPS